MSVTGTTREWMTGFAASLAIHLSVAAIVLSTTSPMRHVAPADGHHSAVRRLAVLPPPSTRAAVNQQVNDATPPTLLSRTSGTSAEFPPQSSAKARLLGEWLPTPQSLESFADRSVPSEASTWIDHVWQSTLFGIGAGMFTLAFRRNRAHVRYWIWFSASVKFLLPFSLLIALGSQLPWAPAAHRFADESRAISQIVRPISSGQAAIVSSVPSIPDASDWQSLAVLAVWLCGFGAIVRLRLRTWGAVRSALRASTPLDIRDVEIPSSVQIRSAPGVLEPSVIGWRRPILLLPAGIEAHLTPPQLEAVLAHELCHVRRRDNLTASVHMVAEAVFWFHPLVWWIGARLVEERERACDEDVLCRLGDPRGYADGILNVCKRYVATQMACVAGVSGSDLKKRIEAIMRNDVGDRLGAWRRLLLATAGIAAVAAPILIGIVNAPLVQAQSPAGVTNLAFESASIKPNKSGRIGWNLEPQPGGRLMGTNVTAAALIQFAYDRPDFQVSGGPNWLDDDRFDLIAKAEGEATTEQKRLMLGRLLADRFKLTAHTETHDLPIYALVMTRSDGRLGPQLRRTEADCSRVEQPAADALGIGFSPADGPPRCGYFGFTPSTDLPSGHGGLGFRGLKMDTFAKALVPMVRRSVVDRTGLNGYFDADFDFMAELPPPPPPPGMPNPFTTPFVTVFTVLPEQLGLKLQSGRGPVDVLVIDRAEHPSEN